MKRKTTQKQIIKGVPEDLRKVVGTAVREFRYQLLALNWDIGIVYANEDKKTDDPDIVVEASNNVDRRYLNSKITIYPTTVKKWVDKVYDTDDIEKILAHEVAHIATQHMFDLIVATYKDEGETKDAWENLTTTIGRLLQQVAVADKKK